MKIASFNINDINRRLSNLLSWVRKAQPDIICLQELKAADTEFPAEAIGRRVIMRYAAGDALERRGDSCSCARSCLARTCRVPPPMGNATLGRVDGAR